MSNTKHPENLWFNLGLIVIIIISLALGLAYYIDNLSNSKKTEPSLLNISSKTLQIIANKNLKIPNQWFRYDIPTERQIVEKIELVFLLPILDNEQNAYIDVTIEPLRKAQTSILLLNNVYLHQFLPQEIKQINGLIGKPLKDSLGNIGETVFYDPISAKPFTAKCMQGLNGNTPKRCIRTVQISEKLVATYSFDYAVLIGWRQFDVFAQKWLAKIEGL